MDNDDLEVRKSLHDAVEDEPAGADGLLQRVADRVDEVVVHEPLRLGEPGRVEEDHEPELFDLRPEVVETGLKISTPSMCVAISMPLKPSSFAQRLSSRRPWTVLHRIAAEGEETVGAMGLDLGQVVVDVENARTQRSTSSTQWNS